LDILLNKYYLGDELYEGDGNIKDSKSDPGGN